MRFSSNPRNLRTLASLTVLAVSALVSRPNRANTTSDAEFDADAFLRLHAENDYIDIGKYESAFFKTLVRLAENQKLKPREYLFYRSDRSPSTEDWSLLTDGRAVSISAKGTRFVVAVLGSAFPDVQQLLLLNERGQILDKAACGINSRYGIVKTEVPKIREPDGAQLIVRFVPRRADEPCHYWHKVTYRDQAYTFRRQEDDPQPTEWTTQGLCRIAIRDGKFAVVWPKLGKSDAEVLKEKKGK